MANIMRLGGGGGNQYVWNKYTTDLPNGYTQVEYIESTGTQYIDTKFNPNNNTRIVIDLEFVHTTSYYFYGAKIHNDSSNTWFGGGYTTLTNLEVWFGNLTNVTVDSAEKRRIVDHNKNFLSTNDGYSATLPASTFQSINSLYLFAMNQNGAVASDLFGIGKLYSCQIYDNGALVRDLVPCKNANGKVGLYDCANGVFYSNAGSGEFVAGNAVDTEVKGEYIGQVKNSDVNAYPYRGVQDGYYYVAAGETINIAESGIYDVRPYVTANVNTAPVLLWTNASPTSSFADQTVTVGSGYDGYLLELKTSTTVAQYTTILLGTSGTGNELYGIIVNAAKSHSRYITPTSSGVIFSGGLEGTTSNNKVCIPTRIWGVKFTL